MKNLTLILITLLALGCCPLRHKQPTAKVVSHIESNVAGVVTIKGLLVGKVVEDSTTYYIDSHVVNLSPLLGFAEEEEKEIYFTDYVAHNVKIRGVLDERSVVNAFSLEFVDE